MTQKQEIEAVKQLGETIGYGNMMALATALWRKDLRDHGYPVSGAFIATVYPLLNEEGKEIADRELPLYDKLIEKTFNYPIAFLTSRNKLFMKSENDVSYDGSPRYVPNPNATATYAYHTCIKDSTYTPLYTQEEVNKYLDKE